MNADDRPFIAESAEHAEYKFILSNPRSDARDPYSPETPVAR
jgi:hypothetical protein